MDEHIYPDASRELAQKRRELAPEIYAAFRAFGQRVFADGALPSKTKQLIAVAVAHVTQCPYWSYRSGLEGGGERAGAHGGDLGRRRDAGRRRLRPLDSGHRRDESRRRQVRRLTKRRTGVAKRVGRA